MPHFDYSIAAYYVIATAEASSNLARFDGCHYGYRSPNARDYIEIYSKSRAEGFGAEVKRRIMLGTFALSSGYYDAYYLKALKVRNLIRQDFTNAFAKADCLMMPVSPTTAFKSAKRSMTRCKCTWPMSIQSPSTWPACRDSASPAASMTRNSP